MQRTQLAMFGTIIALSAITVIMATNYSEELGTYSLKSHAAIVGHVTLTAYDDDGNVIAYRQTDNVVLDDGDDCISELIFSVTGGTCSLVSTFDRIYIGTGDSSGATEGSTALVTPNAQTGFASAVMTPATGGGGAATLITANFFNVGATIQEASIQESAVTASSVLAIQSFSAIPLGGSDDLTIQWTVTIDGAP